MKIKKNLKYVSAFLWNSIGVSIYMGCKWLTTILIVRWSANYVDPGNYSLAFTISNIFVMFGAYGVRQFQVSDYKNEFSNSTYVSSRVVTSFMSLFIFFIYIILSSYSIQQILIISIYLIFMVTEMLGDAIHGVFQKSWRMDIVGISFAIRGILCLIAFSLLYKSLGLFYSILGMTILSFIVFFVIDVRISQKEFFCNIKIKRNNILQLLKKCFPLAVLSVFSTIVSSYTKITLERITTTSDLGIYATATMPTLIMYLISSYVFNPLVNVFTTLFAEGNIKAFKKLYVEISFLILFLFFLAVVFFNHTGEFILVMIFGSTIEEYAYLLSTAIIYTGLMVYNLFQIIILTILRKLKSLTISYSFGLIVCFMLSGLFIQTYGTVGANYIQILCYGIISLIFNVLFVFSINKAFTKS